MSAWADPDEHGRGKALTHLSGSLMLMLIPCAAGGTVSQLFRNDAAPSITPAPNNWLPSDGTLVRRDGSMVLPGCNSFASGMRGGLGAHHGPVRGLRRVKFGP